MSTGSLQIQQLSQQEQEQLQQQQQRHTPTKQQQFSPQRQLYNPEEGPSPEATKKVLTEHDLPQVRANPSLIHQRCVCELCSCGIRAYQLRKAPLSAPQGQGYLRNQLPRPLQAVQVRPSLVDGATLPLRNEALWGGPAADQLPARVC